MTAPLQVIAVSFTPDAGFEGRVLDEVDRLEGHGILRVLDMLFVAKRVDGTLEQLSIGDDEDFGSLLSGIVPTEPGGLADAGQGDDSSGFDRSEAGRLALALLPGTALAFLLVEHHWAAPLFEVIAETGGTLLGGSFLSSNAGRLVGAEVAAMEETAQVIAEAQAIEGRALLRAITAGAEADEAVAASEAIQSAAAADALQVLMAAGLVEETATHEAVTALATAGLIVAAADRATDEAVADDAATITAADEATAAAVANSAATISAADRATAAAIAEDAATINAADEVAAEADEEAGAKMRAASITVAEAQVLRYLPKALPFAVIADKLGISRSAAKERAERVYKKLGVHNRGDAVTRARELRLLRS